MPKFPLQIIGTHVCTTDALVEGGELENIYLLTLFLLYRIVYMGLYTIICIIKFKVRY